jgi:hypothetical protein
MLSFSTRRVALVATNSSVLRVERWIQPDRWLPTTCGCAVRPRRFGRVP